MTSPDLRVRSGFWLYDGTAKSQVEIWRRSMRPGTGDHEDDAELRDDQPGEWYEVVYEAAGGGAHTGGGFFENVESAMAAVARQTHGAIRWDEH